MKIFLMKEKKNNLNGKKCYLNYASLPAFLKFEFCALLCFLVHCVDKLYSPPLRSLCLPLYFFYLNFCAWEQRLVTMQHFEMMR